MSKMATKAKSAIKDSQHLIDIDWKVEWDRKNESNQFYDLKQNGIMKAGLGTAYKKNKLTVIDLTKIKHHQLIQISFYYPRKVDKPNEPAEMLGTVKMRVQYKIEGNDFQIQWEQWSKDKESGMNFTNNSLSFPTDGIILVLGQIVSMTAVLLDEIEDEPLDDGQGTLDDEDEE